MANGAELNKHLNQLLALIDRVSKTVALGLAAPENRDGNYDWLSSFEPYINQRLLPPTFPRQAAIVSRREGWKFVKEVVERMQSIAKVGESAATFCSVLVRSCFC